VVRCGRADRARRSQRAAPAAARSPVEIDLPHGGVWLTAPGDYEITAGDAHDPAKVAAFTGKVELGGGLDKNSLVMAAPDAFSDHWRAQREDAEAADVRHLSPRISGAAALDAAGTWETDAHFGEVWYPNGIAADWAPFRNGVWRFLQPWGWTWVDDAAWGFAPSHYGRWARIGERWVWVPGAPIDDPLYSPATVAFLGTAGIGLSRPGDIGTAPAVAWFPLAPGETVGDGNEADYQNRRFAAAVTRPIFAGGRPIAAALLDLPEQRFADAPVILESLGIMPVGATGVAAAVPRALPVLAAVAPPPADLDQRHAFVVQLRDIPPSAPHVLARKKVTLVAAIPLRARLAASTSTLRSTHTRTRLTAARGGA
jgi:hypothetical protein